MSRLTQLRAWWHRWREEFYEDNPISWLVGNPYRAFHIALSKEQLHQLVMEIVQEKGELEGAKLNTEALTRLREQLSPPPISQLPPVWSVSKGEYRWLIVLWSTTLIVVGVVLHYDWHTLVQGFSTGMPWYTLLLYSYLYVLIIFPAILAFISDAPLRAILSPEGTLYIGLTRLESQHVVYGALAHAIARGARRLVFYILPWLFLLGTLLYGTLGAALWFACMALLYFVGLIWFSHSARLTSVSRHIMQMKSIINYITYTIIILFTVISFPLLIGISLWLSRVGIGGIVLPPVWEWFFIPLFWVSLIPPMFLMLTPLVRFHPFWGMPQILVLFGLSWWMTRMAIVRLRVFRRLREQLDTRSSDEDWE